MKPKVTKTEAYKIKVLIADYLAELARDDQDAMRQYRGGIMNMRKPAMRTHKKS